MEGGQPDVEGDAADVDAAVPKRPQHACGEVQAGGRGGNGAFLFREDRLIAVDVLGPRPFVLSGPLDVGRQGGVAGLMEQGPDIGLPEVEDAPALFGERGPAGLDPARETNGIPIAHPLRRPAEDFPETGPGLPDEQEFDLRLAARPPEPGRQDPRVVEDHDVARAHGPRELAEPGVADPSGLPVDDHHPRVVAMGEGMLGDELRRQIVIEIGDAQG